MAAKKNKTVVNLVVIGVIGFVLWKLWPSIKRAFSGGGSSGYTGGGVGASAQPYYPNPYDQQPQSRLPTLSFGGGNPNPSGGGGGGGLLSNFLSLVNAGTYSGSTYAQQDYIDTLANSDQTYLNDQAYQLPDALANLDNLPSYSYNDPNAAWNNDTSGTDVQSYDLSSVSVDPSSYDPGSGSYGDSGYIDSGGGGY